MIVDIPDRFIDRLVRLARTESWEDVLADENNTAMFVDDLACGNIDDAFDGGNSSGEISLARECLKSIGVEWYE